MASSIHVAAQGRIQDQKRGGGLPHPFHTHLRGRAGHTFLGHDCTADLSSRIEERVSASSVSV